MDMEIEEKRVCDHICSGNCRRIGCNCECGEFHEVNQVKECPLKGWR